MNKQIPLVSIICTTYNHERYIAQALEGFLMQKTNFPFEILIHDDASTDNTAAIIHEYESKNYKIIKPVYQTENQYSKNVNIWGILLSKAMGKYVAICEGDDYWIDPNKLQKQIDYLEINPDYGMCYTQCVYYYDKDSEFDKNPWGGSSVTLNEIMKCNCIPTLTVILKSDLFKEYFSEIKPELNSWKMGDYPIWIWFTKNSKIKFMDDVTGIYRVHNNSMSHCSDVSRKIEFVKGGLEIQKYYAQKYNIPISKSELKRMELSIELKTYAIYGKLKIFIKTWYVGAKSDYRNILVFRNYRYLIFFVIPSLCEKRL